ncbi:hypothetical protein T11_4277 [Trichinella zimbabwensis]|uniref:Uncharacterized protein n=1 Tax=Trichinella zimbabwensis TaxID=268475 RepID=A0A0V1GSE7_9BILA|nr:hypothetical protein T11_4277 [Trichinella zimbabwensis]
MVRKQQVKNRGLIDLDHELDAGQSSVLDLRYNGADSPDDEELDETIKNLVALEKMTDVENPLPEVKWGSMGLPNQNDSQMWTMKAMATGQCVSGMFGEVVTERQLADSAPSHKLYPSHQDGSRRSLVVLKQCVRPPQYLRCQTALGKATFTGEVAAGEAPLALPGLRCRSHLTAWRIRQPSMVFQVWPITVMLTHHSRGHSVSREASEKPESRRPKKTDSRCKEAALQLRAERPVGTGLQLWTEMYAVRSRASDHDALISIQVVSCVLTNVTILLMIRLLTTTAVNTRGQRYFIQHYLQEALPTGSKSQRKGADFQLADGTVSVKQIQNAAVNLRDCLHFEFLILADHIEEQPVMTDLHIRLQIPFDVISVQL